MVTQVTDEPHRSRVSVDGMTALSRVVLAVSVGLLVVAGAAFVSPWQVSILVGSDTTASILLVVWVWVWVMVWGTDAASTRKTATREDDSRPAADLVLIAASVASLFGVGTLLLKASGETSIARALMTSLVVATVLLSWLAVHTVFTLRYAHLFYVDGGGIDFHNDEAPDYGDFAYVPHRGTPVGPIGGRSRGDDRAGAIERDQDLWRKIDIRSSVHGLRRLGGGSSELPDGYSTLPEGGASMNRTGTGVVVLGVIVGIVGALMYWAVHVHAKGFNVNIAGLILFWVGVGTTIVGLAMTFMGGRSRSTRTEDVVRTPSGERRYEDQQSWAS
jgi:uncharacterized membrane protein